MPKRQAEDCLFTEKERMCKNDLFIPKRSWLARGGALLGVATMLLAVGNGIDNGTLFEVEGNASKETTHDWNQVYADKLATPNTNTAGAIASAFITDGFD